MCAEMTNTRPSLLAETAREIRERRDKELRQEVLGNLGVLSEEEDRRRTAVDTQMIELERQAMALGATRAEIAGVYVKALTHVMLHG